MTYRTLIEQAKMIAPGNTRSANDWLIRLADVLKAGELMPAERSYLYRLRRVWRKRAAGEDARWNVHGSRAGARPIPRPIAPQRPEPTMSVSRPMQPVTGSGASHDDALKGSRAVHPTVGSSSTPGRDTTTPPVSSLLDKYR